MLGPFIGNGISIRENRDSPIVRRLFHYWEFIVYLVKMLLTLVMVSDKNQLLISIVILFTFVLVTHASEPYQSAKLNGLNFSSVLVVLLIACIKMVIASVTRIPEQAYSELIYVQGADSSEETTQVLVAVALTLIFVMDLAILIHLYKHLVLYLHENKMARLLKLTTCCGCLCSRDFIQRNYVIDSDLVADQESSGDEAEKPEARPQEE